MQHLISFSNPRPLLRLLAVLSLGVGSLSAQEVEVSNVSFDVEGEEIVVRYDLATPKGTVDVCLVRAFLVTAERGDRMPLEAVSGDIGKVNTGTGRELRWHVLEDLPAGLQEEQIGFIIEARLYRAPVMRRVLWIVGGALAAGAGTTATLLLTRDGSAGQPDGPDFPLPPARPSEN